MDGYAQNVRDENGPLLELIEMVASAAAKVMLREEKVQEVKHEEKEANNQLRSLKDKKISLVLGKDGPDVIEWTKSMVLTTKTNSNNVKALRK